MMTSVSPASLLRPQTACFRAKQQAKTKCMATNAPNTSQMHTTATKREVLSLLTVLAASPVLASPAQESENALTQFLKSRQAANGGETILAPIRGARLRLEEAKMMLTQGSAEGYRDALGLIRAASFNCYIFDADQGDTIETKASLLQQNLRFADPCTYSIISRNVTNLLTPAQAPLRDRTYAELDGLVAAFKALDADVSRLRESEAETASRLQNDVLNSLDNAIGRTVAFEQTIKECLGVA